MGPYVGLAGITTGSALVVSSIAGAGPAAVVAGSVLLPTFALWGQVLLFGGPGVAKSLGGQPADAVLIRIVHDVARRAKMPPPAHVFVVPTDAPNAFAAGFSERDMTVAVTTGLRRALNEAELKVCAHTPNEALPPAAPSLSHLPAAAPPTSDQSRFLPVLVAVIPFFTSAGGDRA